MLYETYNYPKHDGGHSFHILLRKNFQGVDLWDGRIRIQRAPVVSQTLTLTWPSYFIL